MGQADLFRIINYNKDGNGKINILILGIDKIYLFAKIGARKFVTSVYVAMERTK